MDKDCPAIEPIVDGIYRERRQKRKDIFVTNEEAMLLKDSPAMLLVVGCECPGNDRMSGIIEVHPRNCCS